MEQSFCSLWGTFAYFGKMGNDVLRLLGSYFTLSRSYSLLVILLAKDGEILRFKCSIEFWSRLLTTVLISVLAHVSRNDHIYFSIFHLCHKRYNKFHKKSLIQRVKNTSVTLCLLSPFHLSPEQHLLVLLHLLILHLFLSQDLNRQISCLLNNVLVMSLFLLTRRRPFQDLIEDHSCCVNVFRVEQLLTDLDFAFQDWMHVHFKQFLCHVLELCSLNVLWYCWILHQIEMLFIHILLCCIQSVFVWVFIIALFQGFFKIESLLFESLKFLGSNHGIDLSDIS